MSALLSAPSSTCGIMAEPVTADPSSRIAPRSRYTSLSNIRTIAPSPSDERAAAKAAIPDPMTVTSHGTMPAMPPMSIPFPRDASARSDDAMAMDARPSISASMSANGMLPRLSVMRSRAMDVIPRSSSVHSAAGSCADWWNSVSSSAPRCSWRASARAMGARCSTMSLLSASCRVVTDAPACMYCVSV
jgi:hypothetical protein